ncbi:MAG: hypothetical protein HRU26_04895, partial [Psychroserpens sp.]|nr:hypothetical protein [Psychroserpens sp.]
MIRSYWNKGKKQKIITIILGLVLLIALFVLRDDYQPGLLFIRKYIFIVLLSILVLVFGLKKFRNTASSGKRIGILVVLIFFYGLIYLLGWHLKLYDYMKTYNVFNDLNKIEINELPLTQNE